MGWKERKTTMCEEHMYERFVHIISDWFDEETNDIGKLACELIEFLRSYELV